MLPCPSCFRAAFQFLGKLVGGETNGAPPETLVRHLRAQLDQCVEDDGEGRPRLTVTLPDRTALDGFAQTLARILATAEAK